MQGYAPLRPRFADVSRIAVLRGGGLGDLLFAMPAVSALHAAYPGAEIVLLGTRGHAELLDGRPGAVDRVEPLPHAPGVHDGAGAHEDAGRFLERLRREQFDLAVQLHGGGRHSNPFLLALGPRHSVGAATPDAVRLERTLPYVYYQHEVVRALEVVGLAGAGPVELQPSLAVRADERARSHHHVPAEAEPFAVVHPGASDVRRRWPVDRFAHVARGLLDDGLRLVIIGAAADQPIEAALAAAVGERDGRVLRLSGRLRLGETAAVLERAAVVVADDSGPRHLAQAVGAPTVGVFWFGNVVNAAPFDRERHRVHLSYVTACPVCGRDVTQVGWTAERCDHEVSFVADVDPDAVLADARSLTATSSLRTASPGVPAPRPPAAG
jgi:ADP-heptose:LPS heptosyltransferase